MESRIRIGKWNKDWEMEECIISGVSRVLYVAETIGVDQYFTPCLISTEQMMRVLQNRILLLRMANENPGPTIYDVVATNKTICAD